MTLADDAVRYHTALIGDTAALERLASLRGWTVDAITRLTIGTDGTRVTIPVRNAAGDVVNILRYAPNPETRGGRPKMLAEAGAPRDLFPPPETYDPGSVIYLVEGEPDAITAISLGLNAVAIPSSSAQPAPERFHSTHDVVVLLDRDGPGDKGANAWAKALSRHHRAAVARASWPVAGDDLTEVWKREGDNFTAVLSGAVVGAVEVAPRRIIALPGNQFAATLKPHDPADDLLGPIFRRNTRVGIAGFIGEGKTSLMLQMVSASAYGEVFATRHGGGVKGRGGDTRWLILDLEQGEGEIKRRLDETGISERNGNVCYAHIPDGLQIDRSTEDREALEDLLGQGWDGVVLDPAYALLSSEPETEAAAREFARVLDRFHREHNFCLVIPMHTRKPQPRQVITLADVYGWSTITRNMQVVLGVQIWEPWVSMFSILKDRSGDIGPKGLHWKVGYNHSRLFHPMDDAIPGQEAIEDAA